MHQLGMMPAERLHHHAGVDLEYVPFARHPDDIDRREADVDRLRGPDREPDAGIAGLAPIENNRSCAEIEIVTPVRVALLGIDHERHVIDEDDANLLLD